MNGMNGMNGMSEKKMSSGPKTRMCYICGRQYGLSSFDIHIKQCKDLWVAREALKIKSERKPVPSDPCAGGNGMGGICGVDALNNKGAPGSPKMNLDEMNRMASETFNTVSLSQCEHCGRSFLHEKLIIHNRSCTADKPGRRAPVKPDAAASKEAASPSKVKDESASPRSPQQTKPRSSSPAPVSTPSSPSPVSVPVPAPISIPASPKAHTTSETLAEDLETKSETLAGHLGGSGGRAIRTANHVNESGKDIPSNTNADSNSNTGTIFDLSKRVEEMENMMAHLASSIKEIKTTISELRRRESVTATATATATATSDE
jgi:zinc-finger of a C2HC-type